MAMGLSGRCLCGKVSFTARAVKREASACHCGMCQRWSAGPFLSVECERGSLDIEGAGNVGIYESSGWATRQFCKTCGSALFWRARDGSADAVSAGALDDKAGWHLASEIFIDEKPAYYDFKGDAKRMTGADIARVTGSKPQS